MVTLLSYILRTAAVFLIIFFIARSERWSTLLIWLMGFVLTRILLSRFLRADISGKDSAVSKREKPETDKE